MSHPCVRSPQSVHCYTAVCTRRSQSPFRSRHPHHLRCLAREHGEKKAALVQAARRAQTQRLAIAYRRLPRAPSSVDLCVCTQMREHSRRTHAPLPVCPAASAHTGNTKTRRVGVPSALLLFVGGGTGRLFLASCAQPSSSSAGLCAGGGTTTRALHREFRPASLNCFLPSGLIRNAAALSLSAAPTGRPSSISSEGILCTRNGQ